MSGPRTLRAALRKLAHQMDRVIRLDHGHLTDVTEDRHAAAI